MINKMSILVLVIVCMGVWVFFIYTDQIDELFCSNGIPNGCNGPLFSTPVKCKHEIFK